MAKWEKSEDWEQLEEWERDRLGTEWTAVVAFRELLDMGLRQDQGVTYRQAIHFGAAVAPTILGKEKRILLGVRESDDARRYTELAAAESARLGRTIPRLAYIDEQIAKLRDGIDKSEIELTLAERELNSLERVKAEITPKKYTEDKLILRDAHHVERNLPVSAKGENYKEYKLDDARVLRIRALHPDPPEHKLGADLIYEFHDMERDLVRVCFIQYKRWNGKTLSLNPRAEEQLERMRKIGCDGLFCAPPATSGIRPPFRFPHCAVFFRPTDELQRRDARLITSGLHIPLCILKDLLTQTAKGGLSLSKENISDQSIDHGLFEDLFFSAFLGSKQVAASDLEQVYKDSGLLENDESLLIHSQEYSTGARSRVRRRRNVG